MSCPKNHDGPCCKDCLWELAQEDADLHWETCCEEINWQTRQEWIK